MRTWLATLKIRSGGCWTSAASSGMNAAAHSTRRGVRSARPAWRRSGEVSTTHRLEGGENSQAIWDHSSVNWRELANPVRRQSTLFTALSAPEAALRSEGIGGRQGRAAAILMAGGRGRCQHRLFGSVDPCASEAGSVRERAGVIVSTVSASAWAALFTSGSGSALERRSGAVRRSGCLRRSGCYRAGSGGS